MSYDTKQVTNIYIRNADNKEQPIFRINYNPDFDFPVVTLITFPLNYSICVPMRTVVSQQHQLTRSKSNLFDKIIKNKQNKDAKMRYSGPCFFFSVNIYLFIFDILQ